MTTDYIGDGSPSTLAANLRQWIDSVPSHARPLLVAAADALAAPAAPALVPLTDEQRRTVAIDAEASMRNDINLSWRDALITGTERAHGITP